MVYEALYQLWNSFILFLPKLLIGLLFILLGWLIGWFIGNIIKRFLIKMKVDQYISRGRKPLFQLSGIVYLIIFWVIFLVFAQAAVQVLGIETLVTAFGSVIAFLPGLFGAIIFVVVSYVIAEYVRRKIEESDVSYANIIGKVLFFLIVYIGIAMALPLIKINTFLINAILLIILGSFGLGIALAIGLGLKDTIAELAKKQRRKKAS